MEYPNDKIELLSQSIIEKIAAGEIIEGPASVLKELIENAIDAGAEKIDIDVEDAGFSCIRIIDNGRGMSKENLRKSILRHATSKIRTADDLYALTTMGFRGEALASIAAVSRLTIASADSNDGLAFSMQCDGGETGVMTPVSRSRGTSVIVRDLFFNVPARKKFMKTRKAERMALLRLIEQLSVPFPRIHFSAMVEGRKAADFPPEQSVRMRISQIAGLQFAQDLIYCSGKREGMEAVIHVSAPNETRMRPRFQDLYVNRRKVENDQILFAVREAFAQFIKTEFKPSFFCLMTIDPARIDVNVHPAKLKIKFEDERLLFGFIFETMRRGIDETRVKRNDMFSGHSSLIEENEYPKLNSERKSDAVGAKSQGVFETLSVWKGEGASDSGHIEAQTILSFPPAAREKIPLDTDDGNAIQLIDGDRNESWGVIPCYQIHATFVLAPIKNGILLIDQHAAHERILYEQALNDCKRGCSDSQQLLFPIVVELSPSEKDVVLAGNDFLSAVGFEIRDFGGNAISVAAIPGFMKDYQVESAIREIIGYLLSDKNDRYISETQKRFAAAFACGAAIKAGQKLSQEEMNALLNSLFGTENPYICPHGRPTVIRLSLEEIGRRFLRQQ